MIRCWLVTGGWLFVLLALALAAPIPPQTPATASEQVQQRKTSPPYSGDLSIFEYKDRDQKLHIDRVMDILGIVQGKIVADIGAGSGWFSVRAARRVTRAGLVYAVDINPEAIRYIQKRMVGEGIGNVRTILSKPEDPCCLQEASMPSCYWKRTTRSPNRLRCCKACARLCGQKRGLASSTATAMAKITVCAGTPWCERQPRRDTG